MKRLPAALLSLCCCAVALFAADEPRPRYLDPAAPLDERVEDLLPRLTLEEKLGLIHADSKFSAAGVPRLGIPKLWISDGPHGVREELGPHTWRPAGRTDDFATWLPVSIALAATWNPELAQAYGDVLAAEARARGKHILLGPGVNLQRTPLNGRTFEYLGEDPWLAARMAVGVIRGMQAGDVAACVKHLALNNQEHERGTINVEVDERALRELYLAPFEAAVREAGAWSVMGAYNKFRGQYCCHNAYLLNDVLKGEWGFRGLVMSDWGGTHSTAEAARDGLDLEMGTRGPYADYFLAAPFRAGIERGEFPLALLDDKVRRNLRVLLATRALDARPAGALNTRAHQALARQVAEEGLVLLKNSGALLPLDLAKVRRIAVIGDNAVRLQAHGGQSSEIKAFYEITPLAGLLERVDGRADVTFSLGVVAPQYRRLESFDVTGTAEYAEAPDRQLDPAELVERAVAAAQQADVAIVVAGLNHERHNDTESTDRLALELPYGQPELIARVAEANPRTVVVLVAGSPVAMDPWLEKVPAVVQAWYAGMEGGRALASVLFGDVNPSGKLPCTFPRRLADSAAHASGLPRHYPGEAGTVHYDEGLLVGYRWNDAKGVEPLFPFGFGLSYTTFALAGLAVSPGGEVGAVATIECAVTNTGARAGAEVVQVYVEPVSPAVERPVRELKGFAKIALQPGETRTVRIPLGPRAFSYYSPERRAWIADAGEYRIVVGRSSRDLPLRAVFQLPTTIETH
ncbi:MAG TPA: glycoside hydrolase family 3 C-terminal domain-containing protein [Opitutaceae bacterium]|nr:glycoside hydrolase family 3 C-terminal domain-containing protein [Opitutaceae bacterium]